MFHKIVDYLKFTSMKDFFYFVGLLFWSGILAALVMVLLAGSINE
jgi:hypothetical protein